MRGTRSLASRLVRPLGRIGLALVLGVVRLAAQAAPMPPVVQEVPGSKLEIYVMTMGQGPAIWERFGHNALGIRDRETNTNVVYNWGVFRFGGDFLPRFIRGETRYWVEAWDAALTVASYERDNRSVEIQELDLTPAQRQAIREFAEWNAREENKFYRYDYFGDNCSTRVRDVIDRVLAGSLHTQFDTIPTGRTFRDEARRLTEGNPLYTGIDIGLGSPSDRLMSQWESMFIPMTLRDRLRDVKVTGADGVVRPLVSAERVVFKSTRIPEPATHANHQLAFLLIGCAIAALFFVVGAILPAGGRTLAAIWCVIAGIFGVLLVGLWGFTRHGWAYENVNLLYFNPLWFGVAWLVARRAGLGQTARRFILFCAALSIVGVILGALEWPQASEQVALLALAPHAWVLATLWRRARP